MSKLTDNEQNVLNSLGDVWNSFLELPIEHPDDLNDFKYGIHLLQRQIMCRPIRREINDD